jgi:pimeloyl-ACP methyl ester carboxylesterase
MQEALPDDQIYYRASEIRSDRPTLFFIHGLSGSSSAWIPYEKEFDHDYNTVAVDLRGHGKSFRPAQYEQYDMSYFTADVVGVIDHLHLRDIVLISHSLGTLVALEVAQKDTRVMGSVLISPNFEIHRGVRGVITQCLVELCSQILRVLPIWHRTGTHVDYSHYRNTGDWNVRRMSADIPNTGFHSYLYAFAHAYTCSRQADWRASRVPTLIIQGQNDTLVPLASAKKLAGETGAQIKIVHHADHMVILNNVREVAGYIKDFLILLKK